MWILDKPIWLFVNAPGSTKNEVARYFSKSKSEDGAQEDPWGLNRKRGHPFTAISECLNSLPLFSLKGEVSYCAHARGDANFYTLFEKN